MQRELSPPHHPVALIAGSGKRHLAVYAPVTLSNHLITNDKACLVSSNPSFGSSGKCSRSDHSQMILTPPSRYSRHGRLHFERFASSGTPRHFIRKGFTHRNSPSCRPRYFLKLPMFSETGLPLPSPAGSTRVCPTHYVLLGTLSASSESLWLRFTLSLSDGESNADVGIGAELRVSRLRTALVRASARRRQHMHRLQGKQLR